MVRERTGVVKTVWPGIYVMRWKCYGCEAEEPAPDELGVHTPKLRWSIVNGLFKQEER